MDGLWDTCRPAVCLTSPSTQPRLPWRKSSAHHTARSRASFWTLVTKQATCLLLCGAAGRSPDLCGRTRPPMRAGGGQARGRALGRCVGRVAWPEPALRKVHLQTHSPRQGEVRASLDAINQHRNAAARPGQAARRRQRLRPPGAGLLAPPALPLGAPLCLQLHKWGNRSPEKSQKGTGGWPR